MPSEEIFIQFVQEYGRDGFGVRQCLVGLLEQTNDSRPQMDIMKFM